MTRTMLLLSAAILTGTSSLASAQASGASVYATYGTTNLTASDTFEAAAGTSRKSAPGIGGTVTGLWRGLFVDLAFTQYKLDAQRVFIDQGTVFPLGIPVRITMRPLDLVGGWRYRSRSRVSPYGGAGIVFFQYREDSDFATAGDDVSERKTGVVALAGADVRVLRLVSVGGEFRYRAVDGVLGVGGVSQIFGDDQLGGLSLAARFSVGR
jgi:opacity protein-like surface antigen